MSDRRIERQAGKVPAAVLISLASLVVAGGLLYGLLSSRTVEHAADLRVYCAAGIRPAVEAVRQAYEKEFGVKIDLQTGSSGSLLNQIRQYPKGDVYIPGEDYYINVARRDGLVEEVFPLARFRLCIAVAPGNPKRIREIDDLFRGVATYSMPNEETAAGHKAKEALTASGHWEIALTKAKTAKPTVTEVASDVQVGAVDAGIVWDSTARQFGLDVVYVPQFQQAQAQVAAAVLAASEKPTEALRFARYLAAPEKGQMTFKKEHFVPIEGDPWAVTPEITLYSGGVNRPAIEQTVYEFEQREGAKINIVWAGCGVLVSQMKGGAWPDMYFACDVSYSNEVRDAFLPFDEVSKMRMMILVKPGNSKGIRSVEDLARPGLRIAVADERYSALGALTKRLLEEAGVYQQVEANTRVKTASSPEVVSQVAISDQLDAGIVYEANAIPSVREGKAELVAIEHDQAIAIQPLAVRKDVKYPRLMHRLKQRLESAESRKRFEEVGFEWVLPGR